MSRQSKAAKKKGGRRRYTGQQGRQAVQHKRRDGREERHDGADQRQGHVHRQSQPNQRAQHVGSGSHSSPAAAVKAVGLAGAGKKAGDKETEAPVQKNGICEAEIIGIGHEGEGVGRVRDFTLFIPGALPGERVRVKVLKVKKHYGYAKLLDVLQASPERVAAPCPLFDQCGGCQLQHLSYEGQLRFKRQHVIDCLERIGKLRVAGTGPAREEKPGKGAESAERSIGVKSAPSPAGDANGKQEAKPDRDGGETQPAQVAKPGGQDSARPEAMTANAGIVVHRGIVVHPVLGMDKPWHYRNKAQVPIGEQEGGLVGGFYAQGSHRIIEMDACLIQHDVNDEAVRRVKAIAREMGIPAYDESTGRGLLRHVVIKSGRMTGEVMVVLITNGGKLPREDEWIARIREAVPGVRSICQNVNTRQTNVIFGDETRVLWGSEVIHDAIGGVRFAISARSFYQVNPVQTEVLYRKALEYAQLTGSETVIDAYCGIGTISLFLAQAARRVYGVEVVPEAIEDARRNAELNGIANVEFEAGRAEDVMPAWQRRGIRADVVVVDPPRKGCDAGLLETIAAMQPKRIVYVSCNPATLARDLRVLEDFGYRTIEVQPVDMFPHTVHVECIVSTYFTG